MLSKLRRLPWSVIWRCVVVAILLWNTYQLHELSDDVDRLRRKLVTLEDMMPRR